MVVHILIIIYSIMIAILAQHLRLGNFNFTLPVCYKVLLPNKSVRMPENYVTNMHLTMMCVILSTYISYKCIHLTQKSSHFALPNIAKNKIN